MTSSEPTAIGAYTAAEVGRLAGVSSRRIGRWASEGILRASVDTHPNLYSYADAGEAIVAHYLVDQGKAPSEIRKAVDKLRQEHGEWPLAHAPLAHDGAMLLEWDGESWVSVDLPDQGVVEETLIDLTEIRESLGYGGWAALKHRREHIEVDPDRHSGMPVVRGSRLATSVVAAIEAETGGRAVLHEDYGLTDEQIDDAVEYEAAVAELAA